VYICDQISFAPLRHCEINIAKQSSVFVCGQKSFVPLRHCEISIAKQSSAFICVHLWTNILTAVASLRDQHCEAIICVNLFYLRENPLRLSDFAVKYFCEAQIKSYLNIVSA
jgi:hypothetical protein